jgi:hypothetical protein
MSQAPRDITKVLQMFRQWFFGNVCEINFFETFIFIKLNEF